MILPTVFALYDSLEWSDRPLPRLAREMDIRSSMGWATSVRLLSEAILLHTVISPDSSWGRPGRGCWGFFGCVGGLVGLGVVCGAWFLWRVWLIAAGCCWV